MRMALSISWIWCWLRGRLEPRPPHRAYTSSPWLGNTDRDVGNTDRYSLLTASDVEGWLAQARGLDLTDATVQRGIIVLEQLLAALTPKETTLLPNYPNPFNPETWIPYQLATDSDVTLTIYTSKGAVVRRFELGHQPAGLLHYARAQAAYWDGRNANGESVASGIYFYQLRAGELFRIAADGYPQIKTE